MEEKTRKKLIEEVDKYSTDDEVVALYSAYTRQELEYNTFMEDAKEQGLKQGKEEGLRQGKEEGLQQGIKQGIKQGTKQGIEQGTIAIAKNMLKENVDIEFIVKVTNLTKKQIREIM